MPLSDCFGPLGESEFIGVLFGDVWTSDRLQGVAAP